MSKLSKIAAVSGAIALIGMASLAQAGTCNIGGMTAVSLGDGPDLHTVIWGNGLMDKPGRVTVNFCGEPNIRGFYDVAWDGNWFIDLKVMDILHSLPLPIPGHPWYCSTVVTQTVKGYLPTTCTWGPVDTFPLATMPTDEQPQPLTETEQKAAADAIAAKMPNPLPLN